MTSLTLRLPDSLHREIKYLIQAEGISMNLFLTLAAAEKVSALRTIEHLRAVGEKSNRADFDAFLNAVPDVEADKQDRIN